MIKLRKKKLVVFILCILLLSGCNSNSNSNSKSNSNSNSNSNNDIVSSKSEVSKREDLSKLEKVEESSKKEDVKDLEVLYKSNVYSYVKAFNTMKEGVIWGNITQSIGKTKNITDYYCYKYDNKVLSVIKSYGGVAWAEIADGNKYYALNMSEKVYEELDSISLNTYNELMDLFSCADGFEAKGAKEAIHLNNSEYGVDVFLDCSLETNGVHINIVKNDGSSTGKEINITVSKLTEDDKKLFDISDYEKQEKESYKVSEASMMKPEEISIPNNLD